MDHFQASGFFTPRSDRINVACLPDALFGTERLARWVEFVLRDCASGMTDPASLYCARRTAVIVLAPGPARAHADPAVYGGIVRDVLERLRDEHDAGAALQLGADAHRINVLSQDRTGLGEALLHSARQLGGEEAEQVLVLGVDSYLNAGDINAALRDERLFVPGNSNGFVPGEAAAAVVLRAATVDAPGLHIKGVGQAHEPGRHDGSVPSRGKGLTEAIRAACKQAKLEPTELAFRISDQNGEQFFSKDAANAITRVTFGGQRLAQLTIADKIGEVGAVAGLAMLAWLLCDMAEPALSPGQLGLLHLANDNGDRCAIILRHNLEG
ncbi:hypothetical protein IV454_10460 [Massilia antarctica]|uniref:3-oxoacyl-ACP synthase n=1 Tax=Massilia antarctica TaxID=2765360 RepID=A0AA49AAL2_9BURK|nr:hypothetical protein [Massilia antarctica]QPI51875.1 hypothetical protein IV454_10460 [Massilia antarctica]